MGIKTQITQILNRLHKLNLADRCDKVIEIALYVLIFCLPFSKALIEIAATFMILAWLTKKVLTRERFFTYLNIPIAIYILSVFVSVVLSVNFSLSFRNFFSKTMEYILLYSIVAEFVYDKRKLKNIIIVMLISAAMISFDCVFQYFFKFDLLRFRDLEAGRITGSFQMPGDLAGYLGPVFCVFLSLSFLSLKRGVKYLLRLESVLLLSILIATLARGAWVGLAAAICFLGMFENKKILYIGVISSLILSIALSHVMDMPVNILERLKSIFTFSNASSLDRRVIWQAALRMIQDKPFFGHGLSTFMGIFPKYGKDYFYLKQGIIPYAHNCYLQIAAETGIVGLLSFLGIIGTFLIHTVASLRNMKDRFSHAVLAGISAGIIVTLVHSLVDTNLYSLQLSVLFWVMLGVNAGIQSNLKDVRAKE